MKITAESYEAPSDEVRSLAAEISPLLNGADVNIALSTLINLLALGLVFHTGDLERSLASTHRALDAAVELHCEQAAHVEHMQ